MISGRKIAVVGLGLEGLSAAKFLTSKNDVSVFDDKGKNDIEESFLAEIDKLNIKCYLSGQLSNEKFDIVVRSPGVKTGQKTIQNLSANGASVTTPTNIFLDCCECEVIAVTGTKGKGTTSTLIFEILKTKFDNVFLAGNIGTPALDLIGKINKDSKVVLELSSFQLFDIKKSPHIAVVLMVTSEHLDWHENSTDYIAAKSKIVKYQQKSDFAVINQDFENSKIVGNETNATKFFFSQKEKTNGVYKEGTKFISEINGREEVCSIDDIKIPGEHNYQNVMAAIAVAKIYEIGNNPIKYTINSFKGLPHRLQLVAKKKGVKYYNDSFSTTPETTIAALNAFTDPKILILGGSSKKSDFSDLIKVLKESRSIKAVIFIGPEGEKIKTKLVNTNFQKISGLENMHQVIKSASEISNEKDIVLLSPACASFGMFKNYKDRGNKFVEEVNKL